MKVAKYIATAYSLITNKHVHMLMYALNTCIYTHVHGQPNTCTCMHIFTHTHTHARTHAHTHTYTHTHARMHTYTHTHTHIYTHLIALMYI